MNDLVVCSSQNIKIFYILGIGIKIIFISIPILLTVFGIIDLFKYFFNENKGELKKIYMKFIIAVSIFFLMPFITFIFSLLDVKIDNACYQCVENPTDNKCMEIVNQSSIDECGFQSHSSSCCSKKYNSNGFVYKYNIKSKSCDR